MEFVGEHSLGVMLAGFGALALASIWFAKSYNNLVRLRNRAEATLAEIDVQLRRRHDLVPNLVAVVAGYATHERTTLDAVTEARTRAVSAHTSSEQAEAEDALTASLARLFVVAESYPDLKAQSSFKELQDQLAELELVIAQARSAYNLTVQAFNNAVLTVPGNLVAWCASMSAMEYLSIAETERDAPSVDIEFPPMAATG